MSRGRRPSSPAPSPTASRGEGENDLEKSVPWLKLTRIRRTAIRPYKGLGAAAWKLIRRVPTLSRKVPDISDRRAAISDRDPALKIPSDRDSSQVIGGACPALFRAAR